MIYPVHQMTGFDMKYNTGLKGVNVLRNFEVEWKVSGFYEGNTGI